VLRVLSLARPQKERLWEKIRKVLHRAVFLVFFVPLAVMCVVALLATLWFIMIGEPGFGDGDSGLILLGIVGLGLAYLIGHHDGGHE
jgi:hypothetical protein